MYRMAVMSMLIDSDGKINKDRWGRKLAKNCQGSFKSNFPVRRPPRVISKITSHPESPRIVLSQSVVRKNTIRLNTDWDPIQIIYLNFFRQHLPLPICSPQAIQNHSSLNKKFNVPNQLRKRIFPSAIIRSRVILKHSRWPEFDYQRIIQFGLRR